MQPKIPQFLQIIRWFLKNCNHQEIHNFSYISSKRRDYQRHPKAFKSYVYKESVQEKCGTDFLVGNGALP